MGRRHEGMSVLHVVTFLTITASAHTASAQQTEGVARPPGWSAELPTVEDVRKAVPSGKDPSDTGNRQAATLAVLQIIIEGLTGKSSIELARSADSNAPAPGATRWLEYRRAMEATRHGLMKDVWTYSESETFQREILKKYFSKASQDAYAEGVKASQDDYKKSVTDKWDAQQAVSRKAAEERAAKDPVEASAKGKSAATEAALERPGTLDPAIARDVARASARHVSTTVMGVPLGEKLTLPKCSEIAAGDKKNPAKDTFPTGYSKTCIPDGDRNAMIWGTDSLPGWVRAPRKTTVEDRVLLGASFLVTETEQLAKDLVKKYGPPHRQHEVKLQNNFGATSMPSEMEWSFPGLAVHYRPTTALPNGSVIDGELEIELETLAKRERGEKQKIEDAEPHL
jgi:hypothetical protein